MQLKITQIKGNAVTLLRKSGYIFQRQAGKEMSFVRSFSSSGYPRFHIYLQVNDNDLVLNIHLDRKKETYGRTTRHHGEYENEGLLAEEVNRLKAILK